MFTITVLSVNKPAVRGLTLLAFLALASLSCKPKPTVVLDGWWLTDYARESCERVNAYLKSADANLIPASQAEACLSDPASEARQFGQELAAEFASNPICHGLNFDIFKLEPDAQKAADEMKQPSNWTLMVSFDPGTDSHSWNVSRGPEGSMFVRGTGNSKEIAAKVCAVVNQRGAELLK